MPRRAGQQRWMTMRRAAARVPSRSLVIGRSVDGCECQGWRQRQRQQRHCRRTGWRQSGRLVAALPAVVDRLRRAPRRTVPATVMHIRPGCVVVASTGRPTAILGAIRRWLSRCVIATTGRIFALPARAVSARVPCAEFIASTMTIAVVTAIAIAVAVISASVVDAVTVVNGGTSIIAISRPVSSSHIRATAGVAPPLER